MGPKNRTTLAFVIAPLWVPLIVGLALEVPKQFYWLDLEDQLICAASAVEAYCGTFLIGVPAYRFFRARNWTSVWLAVALGFVAGIVVFEFFYAAIHVAFGGGVKGLLFWPYGNPAFALIAPFIAYLMIGGLGALVGVTLWLIARPDK